MDVKCLLLRSDVMLNSSSLPSSSSHSRHTSSSSTYSSSSSSFEILSRGAMGMVQESVLLGWRCPCQIGCVKLSPLFFVRSMVLCLFCFENCTPEGRKGREGKFQNKAYITFHPRNIFTIYSTSQILLKYKFVACLFVYSFKTVEKRHLQL